MRMVRWMCSIKVKDRFPNKQLRKRLRIDDSKTGCDGMGMCCKKDDDWVKKCMEYEVKGSKARGRLKRTWT